MNIKIDSRKIQKGDTFIALRGQNDDGHKYVLDAIKNGATCVIVEEGSYDVDTIVVSDTKKYLEEYLENNYYDDIKNLIRLLIYMNYIICCYTALKTVINM